MTKAECENILTRAGFLRYDGKGCAEYWYQPGIYELSYGEYEAPDYYVRHRKNGQYGIKVVYYYYPGTFNTPSDHFLTPEELFYLDPANLV